MLHERIYLAALILTTGAIGYRLAAAARIAAALKGGVKVREDLSAEELAFLAGGPRRVVTTVLFRMKREGRLSVAEDGTVTLHDDLYAADTTDGIEKALVEAAGVSRAERLGKLVGRAATSRAVRSVGDRLRAEGLLVAPSLRGGQHRARRLLWWSAALPVTLTVYELTVGAPHRWWAGLALSVVAAVPARLIRPVGTQVPYRVQSQLDTLRAEHGCLAPSRPTDALTTLAATPLGAVALDGLAASRDPALRELVTPETWKARQSPYGDGTGAAWSGAYADWGAFGDAGACGGGDAGGGGCGGGGGGGCGGGS
ncbi:TIGR04222 domain-containing membrane protein [Streptomyces sp. TRM76323]|uniref:TIGR04222 domain-containing membrane protein n=1 Tax=Streptomyces tamarix TaxID=3078565 RepID=A0ABU3QI62_9ACTN|nr:TIGR04222 domain-containing membrane protein [Streptomyces tamarix]MDT9682455.1 TIGR04222 domain-containing membrane protein [Streptomyces tamarix]